MFTRIRHKIADWIVPHKEHMMAMRARPGQGFDEARYIYVPGPQYRGVAAAYAMNAWGSTAIDRRALMASFSRLQIRGRKDVAQEFDQHPLLDMLGEFGTANDAQDSLELMHTLFQQREVFGNSYMYLSSRYGGAPEEVYLLDPEAIDIVPGRDRTIKAYRYVVMGNEYFINPDDIIHFKKPHPLAQNIYFGLSALHKILLEIDNDRSAVRWNKQTLDGGGPAGILVIPPNVPDDERKRIEDEFNAAHERRRRVAVVRAEAGSAVWYEAGLKQRDMDFKEGRILSRQAVFDALNFHVGLVSESSTEAHAKVAERMVLNGVWHDLNFIGSKLNVLLEYYPSASKYRVWFTDIRSVDWQQEQYKVIAQKQFMSVDEMRAERGLGPAPEEFKSERRAGSQDNPAANNTAGSSGEGDQRAAEAKQRLSQEGGQN